MEKISTYNDYKNYVEYLSYLKRKYDRCGLSDFSDKEPIVLPFIKEYIDLNNTILSAKELTSEVFEMALIDSCKKIEPEFRVDEFNKDYLRDLSNYSTREGLYNKNKIREGFLTMGTTGSGKTLILKALSNLLTNVFNCKIKYFPTYTIVQKFITEGYDFLDTISTHKLYIIFIDDLGSENLYSNYGITTNVILELIYRLYDKEIKCFATTNLDPKSLHTFYGERGYSRMKEMFLFKNLKGADRR